VILWFNIWGGWNGGSPSHHGFNTKVVEFGWVGSTFHFRKPSIYFHIILLHYCFMESIRGILYWDSPLIPINTPLFHIHGFSRDFWVSIPAPCENVAGARSESFEACVLEPRWPTSQHARVRWCNKHDDDTGATWGKWCIHTIYTCIITYIMYKYNIYIIYIY